jgi:excisionase family DNA binding protein
MLEISRQKCCHQVWEQKMNSFELGRKRPGRVTLSPEEKLLVGREEAAEMLSISRRAIDYLLSQKQLTFRRIGSRVLIPVSDLKRFSRADHPQRLAG